MLEISRGPYIHTVNGGRYFPLDPSPHEVDINVIGHHLSMICRYGGACPDYYSVAEHSVYVAREVEGPFKLEALLHDASEAYVGDLIRPLKKHTALAAPFEALEVKSERAIAARYRLAYPMPDAVKAADDAVLAAELHQLMRVDVSDEIARGLLKCKAPSRQTIQCLAPKAARDFFMAEYELIVAERVAA